MVSISEIAEHRSEISALGISEDNFFTVLPSGDDAEVRRGVRTWIDELRTLPQCSQLIHDLLHLIIDDMIVIKAEDRIRSMELRRRLSQMQDKANGCKDYLLKGCPRPRSTYRLLSSSVNTRAERRAPSHLRRDVRFAERVKTAWNGCQHCISSFLLSNFAFMVCFKQTCGHAHGCSLQN